jgi:hypothetical protein
MSKFFELKMRTLFNRFDINQNGTIEEIDFEKWAEKLISLGNLNGDKANELRINIKKIWREHFKNADTNDDGIVSFDEFFCYISEVCINLVIKFVINFCYTLRVLPMFVNENYLQEQCL